VRSANVLVHVIDASHASWPEHARVVREVLEELDAGGIPVVQVLNKVDLLPGGVPPPGAELAAVAVSARTGKGIPQLLAAIEGELTRGLERVRCALPQGSGDVIAWLREAGRIVEEYYRDGTVTVTALVPPKVAGQLRKRIDAAAAERPC